ncbi:hypothetical protein AGJ34_21505 [Cronobacter dublinensis subsp. dublinensis]|nr:hypothetical protein [Cronobacter dublinensis subsp. dublinensis]EGT5729859.1 hypothetical protein [Cronobacter dublinensis subsp. dublinensis]
MKQQTDDFECTDVAEQLLRKFSKKIGTKQEPLIWGVKATPETLFELGSKLPASVDGKKILKTVVLEQQPAIVNDQFPSLKGLNKKTVVFIQNADQWDQEVLLKVSIHVARAGSKALLGFSDVGALSMGIYQFMVSQQISNDGQLSDWAINMSQPIRELR